MKKENKVYIYTFLFVLIGGILLYAFGFFTDIMWWPWLLPLFATNIFLPFYIMNLEAVKKRWQIVFFFLVPFSSFIYIFFDGMPSVINGIRDNWKNLK